MSVTSRGFSRALDASERRIFNDVADTQERERVKRVLGAIIKLFFAYVSFASSS